MNARTVGGPCWLAAAPLLVLGLLACTAHSGTRATGTAAPIRAVGVHPATARAAVPPPIADASPPWFGHVIVIMLENHEMEQMIGNDAAPYFNSLARNYRLETNYYAIRHPSLPNYLALIAGSTFGVDSDCTDCFQDAPNLADEVEASGRTWKAYMEDMPQPCGLDDTDAYAAKHDPFVYFHDIRDNAGRCKAHVVPFDAFTSDLAADTLPNFAWITPNLCHDMHDCGISDGDRWLAQVVPAILASPTFQADGVLFITFDEGDSNAGCCDVASGGNVATLVIAPSTYGSGEDATPATHYSLLRTIEDGWGLPELGNSANAAPLPGLAPSKMSGAITSGRLAGAR